MMSIGLFDRREDDRDSTFEMVLLGTTTKTRSLSFFRTAIYAAIY